MEIDPVYKEFPDIEAILCFVINDTISIPAWTRQPDKGLPSQYVILHRTGGAPLNIYNWDKPDVHLDCYAPDKPAAFALAQQVRRVCLSMIGQRHTTDKGDSAWVSNTEQIMAIQWYPDADYQATKARYMFEVNMTCKK